MSRPDERLEIFDARSIDRLVDGSLSEPERRELLLRMEKNPEAWRRCALAFLEDQAWRTALAAIAPAELTTRPAHVEPVRRNPHPLRWASVAATVLAATFAAGFQAGGSIKASPRIEVAGNDRPVPVAPPVGEIRQVGSFDLIEGSSGEAPPQRFPILSGPGLDDQWLRSQPPSVPDYLRASWERQGYQVAEHRKLMSVQLEDGRHVSIPVDEVQVDYVGQQPL